MKASKNIKIALIVVLGALIVVALVAWQRGGTVASLWSERPPVARRELQELDKKIKPVAERRAKIREQLNKIEGKEQEARDAAAAALKSMSSGERASVEQDMRAGKLSSENAKKRAAVVAFSEYQQAYSLRRQTQALRDGLKKYELELVRALAERDRLEQRAEMVETLGYDPEDAASVEIDYGLLDDLAAQTDDSLASQTALDSVLTPDDVAGASSAADRAELLAEILEGRGVSDAPVIDAELGAQLGALTVDDAPRDPAQERFSLKNFELTVPVWMGIVAIVFLLLFFAIALVAIWKPFCKFCEDVWDLICDLAEAIWDFITEFAEAVWDFICDACEEIWDLFKL